MSRALSLLLAFALLAPACLDEGAAPFVADPSESPAEPPAEVPVAPPAVVPVVQPDAPPPHIGGEDPPPVQDLAPALLLDETIAVLGHKHPIRPSLVVDDQDRPHFYLTTHADGADTAGYLARDADGWRRVAVVSGPSGGIGFGGGLAHGFVDRTPEGGLQIWVWRDADGTTAADNRTDLFEERADGFTVVDSVYSASVYEVLRHADGVIAALLGHYGGNNYVVERDAHDWRLTFFPAYSNRPPGVVTPEGSVAALSDLRLVHFGAAIEPIDALADREQQPIGRAVGGDGLIRVLRQTTWQVGNRVTLSTRHAYGAWTHELVAADPAYPLASECPEELGATCAWDVDHVTAVALAVWDDQPIPVLTRQRMRVNYVRQCLEFQQDYPGCAAPPCVEPGGPTGPWQEYPQITQASPPVLEVAGHAVALETPFLSQVRPAVALDQRGRLHLAYVHNEAFRYLLVDLYPTR